MLVLVHDHANNNADLLDDLGKPAMKRTPALRSVFPDAPVTLTDRGVHIFSLSNKFNLAEKLSLAAFLDDELKKEFGSGINGATVAISDSTSVQDFHLFLDGMKALNPQIKTIQLGDAGDEVVAEKFVRRLYDKEEDEIIGFMGPTEVDCAPPAEGWKNFAQRLDDVYDRACQKLDSQRQTTQAHSKPNF